jgi:pyrroloquinoline quinone (PQQ) biosynthesis protein C
MEKFVESLLKELDTLNSPYFRSLKEGVFEKADFIETQCQLYNAATYFNRPMTVLVAKIPDQLQRIEILRNVWEEHGSGNEKGFHPNLLLEFISHFGYNKEEVTKRTIWPEVKIFNAILAGSCVFDEYLVGASVLSMVEKMFAPMCDVIVKAVVEQGWVTLEQALYYTAHSTLDIKHSQDFLNFLKIPWNESPENRYYIQQGMRMGALAFHNLFVDFFNNRKRRELRAFSGPHYRV